jgi:hypothetical protein
VVIDPPFITEDVWKLYAQAAKLLLKPDGRSSASERVVRQVARLCLSVVNTWFVQWKEQADGLPLQNCDASVRRDGSMGL